MENIVEKISKELENSPELNEENNDIGLPKSSLHSFVKEFLTKNKVRGDKNIIPMLDKISRYYVTFISKVGAQICEDWKKKTLNLEHIFEALKQLKFQKHIELLMKESKTEEGNDKVEEEDEEKKYENKNLKQMINKKKKRGGRKKKYYENDEEKDAMIDLENKIFEEARLDMLKEERKLLGEKQENEGNEDFENNNINLNEEQDQEKKEDNINDNDNDKEKKAENINDNLFIDNAGEEDINFDA
jgi:histone H3/H4